MDAIERYLLQELRLRHDQISVDLSRRGFDPRGFDPWAYRKWKHETEAIENALTSYKRSREVRPSTRRRLPRSIRRKLAELESAERPGRETVVRSMAALQRQRLADRRRAVQERTARTGRSRIDRTGRGLER